MTDAPVYAVAAEYESPEQLVAAARAVRDEGYTEFAVYGPYPIKELDEIVPGSDPVPAMVLAGGVLGGVGAWVMQYYIAAIDYPTNIGGRPLTSWPSFIPIMFELTVLFASLAAFFGTLWLAGLPLPHHPVFNLPQFARASKDRFFLCIQAKDLFFSVERTTQFLLTLSPMSVWRMEEE